MTKFADELFSDLMSEHGSALATARPPVRRAVARPVWLAAGVVGMAGAITAAVTVFSGGTPAYAVTDNGDGTVSISISQLSGVDGANLKLRSMGDRIAVVPVRDGCPAFDSLPMVHPDVPTEIAGATVNTRRGTITVNARGIPKGETALVAVLPPADGFGLVMALINGPAPSCVSGISAPQLDTTHVHVSKIGAGTGRTDGH